MGGVGLVNSLSYIYHMKKLQEVQLTLFEWQDAMRVPTPHRNKKKYYRKNKHKNSWKSEK